MEILVSGGTGKTGSRVASRLAAKGHGVRIASRSGSTRFDWADESTWDGALAGVSAAYLVSSEDGLPPAFLTRAVDAGVRRFVLLSARGTVEVGDEAMLAAEAAVAAVDATIVRPGWFNQNFSEGIFADEIRAGELTLPVGNAVEPFIDAGDIADVVVAALTEDGHEGRVYELSGPAALSVSEAVAAISAASGRPVRFVDISPEDYQARLLGFGVPAERAQFFGTLFGVIRSGAMSAPTDDVKRVLGREPLDFAAYAKAAAW